MVKTTLILCFKRPPPVTYYTINQSATRSETVGVQHSQ